MRQRFPLIPVLILLIGLFGCGESQPTAPSASRAAAPGSVGTVPDGELISGTVSDSGLRRLAGARVEFVDGPQAGMFAITDAKGDFSLRGSVDDTSRFRASKEGHVTATATVQSYCAPCNPKRWVHFYLNVFDAPLAVSGDYSLTFVADSTCRNLPDELRSRTYAVTIAASDLNWPGYPNAPNTSFKVTAAGTNFPPGLNGFYVNVAGNYLHLGIGDHTDPGITERVESHTYLAFGGWGVVTATTPVSTIATSFEGWIDYCVNPLMGERYDCTPAPTVTLARCNSRNHQVSLVRR